VVVDVYPLQDLPQLLSTAAAVLSIATVIACAVVGIRCAPRRAGWFVVTSAVVYWAPFVALDIVRVAWRATIVRYQFPSLLALELGAAIGIAYLTASPAVRCRRVGAAATLLLAVCGAASGFAYARADTWWNKRYGSELLTAVKTIEREPSPLLVINSSDRLSFGDVFTLTHELSDDVRLLIVRRSKMPQIPTGADQFFLWTDPDDILETLSEDGWRTECIGPDELVLVSREAHGEGPGRRGDPPEARPP
jgi:hypothetical protein